MLESARPRKAIIRMEPDDTDDEDEPPHKATTNAFAMMNAVASKKQKVVDVVVVMAVVYIRWLRWIDPSEALHDVPYVGQAVRGGYNDPLKCAKARWDEENRQAKREDKEVGLMAALDMFGEDAFFDEVVEHRVGPREEVQKWASEREIALIAEHGGPLRDPTKKLKQTLNLTKGGKGNVNFAAVDAFRTLAWDRFKIELQKYVEYIESSALVPRNYVSLSGYKLGNRLHDVRQGALWRGHPNSNNMCAWLEALPEWAWKPYESAAFKAKKSLQAKQQAQREHDAGVKSIAERGCEHHRGLTEAQREEWKQSIRTAKTTPAALEASRRKGKEQFASPEARSVLRIRASQQLEREALTGMKSLHERHHDEAMRKREAKLDAAIDEDERTRLLQKFESYDRGNRKAMERLEALRKIPGHEDDKMKDVAPARKSGILLI